MPAKWLIQSSVATAIVIPVWLIITFFHHYYKVKPEIFLIWYFLGVSAAVAIFKIPSYQEIFPSWGLIIAMVAIGLVMGGYSNALLFRAIAIAPNAGLPIAVFNLVTVGVFLGSVVLYKVVPQYFPKAIADPWSFVGVILTIMGAIIIAVRS